MSSNDAVAGRASPLFWFKGPHGLLPRLPWFVYAEVVIGASALRLHSTLVVDFAIAIFAAMPRESAERSSDSAALSGASRQARHLNFHQFQHFLQGVMLSHKAQFPEQSIAEHSVLPGREDARTYSCLRGSSFTRNKLP